MGSREINKNFKKMQIILKKLVIIYLLTLPCMVMAQSNASPVMMQMRNGKIYFDNTYSLDSKLKKEELFNRATGLLLDKVYRKYCRTQRHL